MSNYTVHKLLLFLVILKLTVLLSFCSRPEATSICLRIAFKTGLQSLQSEHTLTTLKAENPNIQEAFLRSDDVGCYHCAYLILSLPSLRERAGIKIVRYDFSDPQAGKDVCGRRIATVKSHMRRFINEGHDIRNAIVI